MRNKIELMQVNLFTFRNEDFVCPKCGRRGKGAELGIGDFSETHFICGLDCPSCFKQIGFWQAPLKEEVEKWKKEHPGIKAVWDDIDNA